MKGKWSWWQGVSLGAVMGLLWSCGEREDRVEPAAEEARGVTSEDGPAISGSAVPTASGGQEEGSKRPRHEGRVPDGRPAPGYRVASPLPGKHGFVFNPFTNAPVDVRGLPPGTLVRDPSDPDENRIFRIPEDPDAGEKSGEESKGGEQAQEGRNP